MESEATPEVAVFGEMMRNRLARFWFELQHKAADRPEVQVEIAAMLDRVYEVIPGTTRDQTGRSGAPLGMTDAEVAMAVTLEESKQFRAPVLYRRLALTSANRIIRAARADGHLWYQCEITKEPAPRSNSGTSQVDLYVDATPRLLPVD